MIVERYERVKAEESEGSIKATKQEETRTSIVTQSSVTGLALLAFSRLQQLSDRSEANVNEARRYMPGTGLWSCTVALNLAREIRRVCAFRLFQLSLCRTYVSHTSQARTVIPTILLLSP